MLDKISGQSHLMLFLTTLAFTVCFAVWMLNGVLVTFLVDKGVFDWTPVEVGWLIGIPVLTGAIFRLPLGLLTDRFGGKPVFTLLLFVCALPLVLLSFAQDFWSFALCSFGFGLSGSAFAVGVAYISNWYPRNWQGRALGIFGAGNAGAGITTMVAPTLLNNFTGGSVNPDGWRMLPLVYAGGMAITALIFVFLTKNKKPVRSGRNMSDLLKPLRSLVVWRLGLYYFLVFGCFVAFAQWLVPYFVNMYYMPLVAAGLIATIFSVPSGLIRIIGGWLSDQYGGQKVMYGVLITSTITCAMLMFPRMEVISPGKGLLSANSGVVTRVSDTSVVVGDKEYALKSKKGVVDFEGVDTRLLVFPTKDMWQEANVKVGQEVQKKELLAKGVTRIYFQANLYIAAILITLVGIIWGIGKAAVYKFIPEYFPDEVGVVGGMVGVIGGLGGFVCPILFGYLLEFSGFWTSCWIFMWVLSVTCYFILEANRKGSKNAQ